ncbi:hypothetical protein EB093_07550 [bacterium]|nr:hypothetical protein [bacterium]
MLKKHNIQAPLKTPLSALYNARRTQMHLRESRLLALLWAPSIAIIFKDTQKKNRVVDIADNAKLLHIWQGIWSEPTAEYT